MEEQIQEEVAPMSEKEKDESVVGSSVQESSKLSEQSNCDKCGRKWAEQNSQKD